MQLNFLITENRPREIVDLLCDGVQVESLDALLSVAIQCVSSSPEDRPTMHRVVQLLESEVVTPCPSDFYDSDQKGCEDKLCLHPCRCKLLESDVMKQVKNLRATFHMCIHSKCKFMTEDVLHYSTSQQKVLLFNGYHHSTFSCISLPS